jgi:hypothetical protein
MFDHRMAKNQFLEWLQEQGKERGYNPEIHYGSKVILETPRLLARTRASVWQHGAFNFKMNDEVEYDSDNFERVFSIILDLHEPHVWDPKIDSFYPLTLKQIKNRASGPDVNGDYPVTINLADRGVELQKDNLQRLFPFEDGKKQDNKTPADKITNEQTRRLNNLIKRM